MTETILSNEELVLDMTVDITEIAKEVWNENIYPLMYGDEMYYPFYPDQSDDFSRLVDKAVKDVLTKHSYKDTRHNIKTDVLLQLCDEFYDNAHDNLYRVLDEHFRARIVEQHLKKLGINDVDNTLRDKIEEYICEEASPDTSPLENRCLEEHVFVWYAPYQADNLNTEGNQLEGELMSLVDPEEYLRDIPRNSVLRKLFASQGYTLRDFRNDEKVKQSKFLTSFAQEAQNLYHSPVLVILAQPTLKDFLDYASSQSVTFTVQPGEVVMGLYTPVSGGGSVLEIELEKPWTFTVRNDTYLSEIQVDGSYGYAVDDVYGLCSSAYAKDIHVNKITPFREKDFS